MVTPALAGKWTPIGIVQRLRVLLRQPGDLALALRIGHFVWSVPTDLGDASLPTFLDRLRAARRPPAPTLHAGVERIARLRQPWLRLAVFGDRNMCYVRALALYRFLDPGAAVLRIHFGVEPGVNADDRLRGHAWISVDGEIFESPDPVRAGRVREIYRHPPEEVSARGARRVSVDDLRTLLAAVVLGDSATAERAAQALSSGAHWPAAVATAAAWRVVPALRRRIAEVGAALDAESARDLGARSRAAAMQATAVAHRAATVLAALRTAGVPAVPFKGIGVIASLYPGAGQRMVQDMDLLVAAPHVEAAAAVFRRLGFAPITDRFAEYIEYLRDRPREGAFSGNQYLIFTDVDRLEIDLHWQLGVRPPPALDTAGIIARAEPARLFGVDISAPAPPDAMALTAHHVLRDGFAPATAIKDLCDLAAWWGEAPERWTAAEVAAHARAAGLAVPLLALWKILASFNAAAALADGTAALAGVCSAGERADGERLAQVFRWQLRHGQLNGDVLRLLSPLVVLRFLARRLRRRRRLEYFDERIESELGLPPPPPFRARISRLLRDLSRLDRRAIAGYRALLRSQRF